MGPSRYTIYFFFRNGEKTAGAACSVLPPLPVRIFTAALKVFKLPDEENNTCINTVNIFELPHVCLITENLRFMENRSMCINSVLHCSLQLNFRCQKSSAVYVRDASRSANTFSNKLSVICIRLSSKVQDVNTLSRSSRVVTCR